LTYRHGGGFVTLFRYGVAALINLSTEEEEAVLQHLTPRLIRPVGRREEETANIKITENEDEKVLPGGPIILRNFAVESLIVVADALSKSVVLARDEREVSAVFEIIEPMARSLAERGYSPTGRQFLLKHIGQALLVRHRVSGRVAVTEKPDVVWDRHDLERLYARVQEDYELNERADTLSRKLEVVADTAETFTSLIDTNRALRLEFIIVLLIAFEVAVTIVKIAAGRL
jgi:uncharacterized Rmd1/YagE family protein